MKSTQPQIEMEFVQRNLCEETLEIFEIRNQFSALPSMRQHTTLPFKTLNMVNKQTYLERAINETRNSQNLQNVNIKVCVVNENIQNHHYK